MRNIVTVLLLLGCGSIVAADSRLAGIPWVAADANELVAWIRRLNLTFRGYGEEIDWSDYYRTRGYVIHPVQVERNRPIARYNAAKIALKKNRDQTGLLQDEPTAIVSPILWRFDADGLGREEILWPVTMEVRGWGLRGK